MHPDMLFSFTTLYSLIKLYPNGPSGLGTQLSLLDY